MLNTTQNSSVNSGVNNSVNSSEMPSGGVEFVSFCLPVHEMNVPAYVTSNFILWSVTSPSGASFLHDLRMDFRSAHKSKLACKGSVSAF